MSDDIAVVVTTEWRGVFFGRVASDADLTSRVLRLRGARMAIYWPSRCRGIVGLAAIGPLDGSRVSPPADTIIHGITAIMVASAAATAAWDATP